MELTATHILLLNYIEDFTIDQKKFDGFWNYRFDVYPPDLIKELVAEGYVVEGDRSSGIKHLKTAELKFSSTHIFRIR